MNSVSNGSNVCIVYTFTSICLIFVCCHNLLFCFRFVGAVFDLCCYIFFPVSFSLICSDIRRQCNEERTLNIRQGYLFSINPRICRAPLYYSIQTIVRIFDLSCATGISITACCYRSKSSSSYISFNEVSVCKLILCKYCVLISLISL